MKKNYHVELPSRFLKPRLEPQTHEEIEPFIVILAGNRSYNRTNAHRQGVKYLPAIRSQGAYFGGSPYPRFTQDKGDIYLVRARIVGEDKKLPSISIGTFATASGATFVNIPMGSSYPNSSYEQRGVLSSNDRTEDIAKAIFGLVNGHPSEVDERFYDAHVTDMIELSRLQEPFIAAARKLMRPNQPE